MYSIFAYGFKYENLSCVRNTTRRTMKSYPCNKNTVYYTVTRVLMKTAILTRVTQVYTFLNISYNILKHQVLSINLRNVVDIGADSSAPKK
jgi:hypothetical protein